MRANYETDADGRLQNVTLYPLDAARPTLELPEDFDLKNIRDYIVIDGVLRHEPYAPVRGTTEQIADLKQRLADTDYVVIKIAEGAATADEYADTIKQRAEWRAEINRLEGQECDA